MTMARAFIAEETGREYRARGQYDMFKENLERAIKYFRATRMMTKAANCHEALGEYAEAAGTYLLYLISYTRESNPVTTI